MAKKRNIKGDTSLVKTKTVPQTIIINGLLLATAARAIVDSAIDPKSGPNEVEAPKKSGWIAKRDVQSIVSVL